MHYEKLLKYCNLRINQILKGSEYDKKQACAGGNIGTAEQRECVKSGSGVFEVRVVCKLRW